MNLGQCAPVEKHMGKGGREDRRYLNVIPIPIKLKGSQHTLSF